MLKSSLLKFPESNVEKEGFFVQQLNGTPAGFASPAYFTTGHPAFAHVEVMRINIAHADEELATYYWHTPGSGIFLNLGRTLVLPPVRRP